VFERLDAMGAESDDDSEELATPDGDSSNLSSSDGDSSDLDSDADVPFSSRRGRKPSREWLRAIRSRLSLDATLRLARRDGEGGGARDADAADRSHRDRSSVHGRLARGAQVAPRVRAGAGVAPGDANDGGGHVQNVRAALRRETRAALPGHAGAAEEGFIFVTGRGELAVKDARL
jgi:hypothetical protein